MTSNTTYSSTFPVGSGQDGNSDTWAMTNGFGVVNAAPQSALTAVWTVQGNGVPAGVGGWAASAVAFKSANFARLRFRIMC